MLINNSAVQNIPLCQCIDCVRDLLANHPFHDYMHNVFEDFKIIQPRRLEHYIFSLGLTSYTQDLREDRLFSAQLIRCDKQGEQELKYVCVAIVHREKQGRVPFIVFDNRKFS